MDHFTGIEPTFFEFFRQLGEAQDREWFQANKGRYEDEVKLPLRELLLALNDALSSKEVALAGDPKRSISRINRDVRFAHDKSPYKTYASLTCTRIPGQLSPGLLYLSLSPDECYVGIGFYVVDPDDLLSMRQAIARQGNKWLALDAALSTAGMPLDRSDTLKRMPKGFEEFADTALADALKLKRYVCKLTLTANELDARLPHNVAAFAAKARPLLDFGWQRR